MKGIMNMNSEEFAIYIAAINAGNLVYWCVAKAMREGSKEDAEWMFEDETLVWC